MHDQPIQLDASFDTSANYTITSWLRTIDSRVVNGEPIVIIDDGTTQRVITAPCTGRIVDIYTEVGAHVLPRTVLGMVRPDLVMPEINQGIGGIVMGIVMIALALVIIPLLNALPVTNLTQAVRPTMPASPSDSQNSERADEPNDAAPMPDAPMPGSAPSDDVTQPAPDDPATQDGTDSGTGVLPDPNDTNPNDTDSNDTAPSPDAPMPGASSNDGVTQPSTDNPTTQDGTDGGTGVLPDPNPSNQPPVPNLDNATPAPDESNTDMGGDDASTAPTLDVPQPTTPATEADNTQNETNEGNQDTGSQASGPQLINNNITQKFNVGIDRIITLTLVVQTNYPGGVISQSEYDTNIRSSADEVKSIIDELAVLVNEYRDYADLNEENRQWFTLFAETEVNCLAIYASIQQAVTQKVAIPDMADNYARCFVGYDYITTLP